MHRIVLLIVGVSVGVWASRIMLDDAMITFRVAENLAYGRGFVYNLGERVQVTTTPLYALILVPGIWLSGSAVQAALILNLGLAAVLPLLAYDVGQRLAGRITGIAGALLLVVSPFAVMAFSMESYLYMVLILATLAAYLTARYRWAGVLIGLTALVRGDGVFLGAVMLTYDALTQRRLCWSLILPAIGIPAGWYLFATGYYGAPFPATLAAKTAQGAFNWLGERFLDGLWGHWDQWTRKDGYWGLYLLLPFPVVGLFVALWTNQRWVLLIGRDGLYIAAFVGLGVPMAEWYYAPLMPGVALLAGRGIQAIAERLAVQRERVGYAVAAGVTAVLLAVMLPVTGHIIQQHPDWKAQIYPPAARWIAANTNTNANLATIDIGHLGYWSERQIIDIVGLAQPDVAAQIAAGDFGYAIRTYEPDMVLIASPWLPEVQASEWFQANYGVRHYFQFEARNEPLLLFTRQAGVKVQENTSLPASRIQPLAVNFNGQILLTGYHLSQPLRPASVLNLTLFWEAIAPISIDYTVFVQLVDANHDILVQRDTQPQGGFYATSSWQPGEQIHDVHAFPLPAAMPSGTYDILVGLYEVSTGQRLPILDADSQMVGDYVSLDTLTMGDASGQTR